MPRVIVSGPTPDKGASKKPGWCCHISIRREYMMDSPSSMDNDDVSVSSTAATPSQAFERAEKRIRKIVGALANQSTRAEEREVYEDD